MKTNRTKKAEKLKAKVLALWDELIPQRRSMAEIGRLAGTSKANVNYIVHGRESRAKGKI